MATARLYEIPDGTAVFIDANIFIYHFSGPTPLTSSCSTLLRRIEEGAIRGLTSTVVLIEVLHRLMILEAAGTFRLPPRDALRYLEEHAQQAKTLVAHQGCVQQIRRMGIEVATIGLDDIDRSHEIKRQYGLLTNDALLVAAMRKAGITALGSNDPDFEAVDGISLYRPTAGP